MWNRVSYDLLSMLVCTEAGCIMIRNRWMTMENLLSICKMPPSNLQSYVFLAPATGMTSSEFYAILYHSMIYHDLTQYTATTYLNAWVHSLANCTFIMPAPLYSELQTHAETNSRENAHTAPQHADELARKRALRRKVAKHRCLSVIKGSQITAYVHREIPEPALETKRAKH